MRCRTRHLIWTPHDAEYDKEKSMALRMVTAVRDGACPKCGGVMRKGEKIAFEDGIAMHLRCNERIQQMQRNLAADVAHTQGRE